MVGEIIVCFFVEGNILVEKGKNYGWGSGIVGVYFWLS